MKYEPHPKNAPGPFYVEKDACLSCMAPERSAPDLMGYDGHECYFRKQPSTPEELNQAIEALQVSCCGYLRYGGDDPQLLERLRDEGVATACDLLEDSEETKGQIYAPLPPSGRLARIIQTVRGWTFRGSSRG